jgi:HNH endonuclease
MNDVLARIMAKIRIDQETGCWEFTGSRNRGRAYGRIGWKGRLWLTHRVTYTLIIGPIPDNLEIDHLCKNPPCCNPAHLEAVTRSVNIQRGTQGDWRAEFELAKTHCPARHPYDAGNTYFTPSGHRQCRICKAEANLRYDVKNRAARAAYSRAWRARRKALA